MPAITVSRIRARDEGDTAIEQVHGMMPLRPVRNVGVSVWRREVSYVGQMFTTVH